MRVLIVTSIIACLIGTAAAQTKRQPTTLPAAAPIESENRDALSSCLNMWDKATHMSRSEWSRACRRVANRIQNLAVK